MSRTWTTPAAIAERAARRWRDGSVLTAYLRGEPAPRLEVPVRGPTPREIGAALGEVRAWRDALVRGSRDGAAYALSEREVGGRVIGRLAVPDRAVVADYAQWWRLLGVGAEVARVEELVEVARSGPHAQPVVAEWAVARPLAALALADEWPQLLAAVGWLAREAGSGRYLREVAAPGVDTKLIERHTGVLATWLDALVPEKLDGRYAGSRGFARRFGFADVEPLLRLRVCPTLGALPAGVGEVALPVAQAAALAVAPVEVLVVENLVTFLSMPVPVGGVVVWGHGFDAGRLGRVPWLFGGGCAAGPGPGLAPGPGAAPGPAVPRVRYWGDLDTHGFAILHLLRTQVPHVESVLMDEATLLAHRDRWVSEGRPTRADLSALTAAERALYEDLVEGIHGASIRLEQERIAWPWVLAALAQR